MRSASSPRRSPSSLLLCLIHIGPNHNFWPIRSLWKLNWKKVFQHSLLDSTQPLSQNFGQRITHSKILFGILLQRKLGHHRLETVSLQCIEVKGQLYVTCMIYIVYLQSDTDTYMWVGFDIWATHIAGQWHWLNALQCTFIPHICHGHKDGVRGEKICHVEKFQISVHDRWGEI